MRSIETKRFFIRVNINGFVPAIPNLFMNIEKPLIAAVEKAKSKDLFMF